MYLVVYFLLLLTCLHLFVDTIPVTREKSKTPIERPKGTFIAYHYVMCYFTSFTMFHE